ncbi:MAG TPA: phosphotransferase [Chloroflexota bacterium]|nr:phosphotransferase [Chloroflexota bacterium]
MSYAGPAEHPSPGSVLDILGLTGIVDPVEMDWSLVTPESRHSIWRLVLPERDGNAPSYVVKSYHEQADEYFDHRFRREERVLDLLGRYALGVAPRSFGGRIISGHSAFLILEDLGDRPLHYHLDGADPAARRELLGSGVDLLARFHRVADEYSGIFRAVCRSSILDRVNAATLLRRFDIAVGRLGGDGGRALGRVRAAFREEVIRPLMQGPGRVIHNSFSPLNICTVADGSQRIVDMETMSIGPAELDLAELLIYPGGGGDLQDEIVARYVTEMGPQSAAPDSGRRLQLAAMTRALDYAGTLATRRQRFAEAGLEDLAGAQERRCAEYLLEAGEGARSAGVAGGLVEYIDELNAATGGSV